MDVYLAAFYPNYFESTRAVLLRQARDLLETAFHGDLFRFEREFLSPAAEIIKIIKNASHNLSVSMFSFGMAFVVIFKKFESSKQIEILNIFPF